MAIPAELQGKASGDAVYFPIAAKDIGSGERALAAMMYAVNGGGSPVPFTLLDGSVPFTLPDPASEWTNTTGLVVASGAQVVGPASIDMRTYRSLWGHFKPTVTGLLTFDWSDDAAFSDYYVRDTERQVSVTTDGCTIKMGKYGDYCRLIFDSAGGTVRGSLRKDKVAV